MIYGRRTIMRSFLQILTAGAVIASLLTAPALADTKIRFTLDWIPGATHGAFLIAKQKGYYQEEGLDVTIDPGKGSAEVVRQIAAGVYDIGFPDINVLMDFNAKNPEQSFPAVMSGYEQAPASIFVLKSSGIEEPKQLEGKKLGSAAHDSTFKLFPIFADINGIDMSSVQVEYIDPRLREALLAQKSVDAIPGQVFNSLLELKAKGVPESEIKYFMYKDYGLELYSNSVAVSPKFMKENPEAVRGFIRATIKGIRDLVKDPEDGVKAALAYEPLLNADIERERLRVAMECCIITETILEEGYGNFDHERLQKDIDLISDAYKLPRKPTLDEMFDSSFLPPQTERLVK
jgi:NitT/TauT family transport system substrate-binding protein